MPALNYFDELDWIGQAEHKLSVHGKTEDGLVIEGYEVGGIV